MSYSPDEVENYLHLDTFYTTTNDCQALQQDWRHKETTVTFAYCQ